MITPRDFFWPHTIMLLGATAPVALAESTPVYLAAVAVAAGAGARSILRNRPPLIGSRTGILLIVLAFGYLLFEYILLDEILVMALSHFIISFCAIRLLQARTVREDVQMIVLYLLLLVVGAIVSGDVLFAVALALVLSLAVPSLTRLYLLHEWSRTGGLPMMTSPAEFSPGPAGDSTAHPLCPQPLRRLSAIIILSAVGIGTAVFLVCPRPEPALLRQFKAPKAGAALTGFDSSVDLAGGQKLSPSERIVMRVQITGSFPFSAAEYETEQYFRGLVREHYGRRTGGLGGGRGWERSSGSGLQVFRSGGEECHALFAYPARPDTVLTYQFWLEPGNHSSLFGVYPLLEISSRDVPELRFNPRHQTLHVTGSGKTLRYTIKSVPLYAAPFIKERPTANPPADPPLIVPDPPLPMAEEIVRRIDQEVGDFGPLDVPGNRERFLDHLQDYLRSPAFSYTLNPPRRRPGREPVGEFLLVTRRGHCEYFASAMTVVCQLKGIQARLVGGYRGGEYNPVGGFLVVREKHAHAWVEAFVPGRGWLTYDPTPGTSRPPIPASSWLRPVKAYIDFFQFQWANLVVSYDAGARQVLIGRFRAWLTRPVRDETTVVGIVVAFVRELFGWRLQLSPGDRLLYWVFALLVIILVLLVGHVIWTVARWIIPVFMRWRSALRYPPGHPDAEFYHRFCRRLESLGFHRRPDQTPAEFADELVSACPSLQPAPQLVRAYYEVVYGGRVLSPHRRSQIDRFLRQLRRLSRHDVHQLNERSE